MKKKFYSVQEWIPIEEIYTNGIIKLKKRILIKIIQITPINFNLKSKLEKEAVLNAYKIFLKTCNFDIQILIQSNKEDLSKHIENIENNHINEENKINEISKKYLEYIQNLNKDKKSSSKKFFIILKEEIEKDKEKNEEAYKIVFEKLNDKYFKIKECLTRCGNNVYSIKEKSETEKIFKSFLNTRIDLNIE